MIIGPYEFLGFLKNELGQFGFRKVETVDIKFDSIKRNGSGILIEFPGEEVYNKSDVTGIPVIYSFDFIAGAAAIVVFSGDDRNWLKKPNIRLWAADYMAGYSAFWNIKGYDWLHAALPAIKENRTSKTAMKTAAYLCARIAANIAVGKEVKRFPQFYLVES